MQLFPVAINSIRPASGGGKDVRLFGIGADGFDYAIKTMTDNPKLPATEYFCYRLAMACRLAVPSFAFLQIPGSQQLAFGSRFEGGLTIPNHTTHEEVIKRVKDCASSMSAAYAMDMFLGNEDRHFGNFLFRSNSADQLACLPIDYSRAWMAGGWPPRSIAQSSCTTMTHVSILRALKVWDAPRAVVALGQIASVQASSVDHWFDEMPEEWISGSDRSAIVSWWGSADFHSRLQDCIRYAQ